MKLPWPLRPLHGAGHQTLQPTSHPSAPGGNMMKLPWPLRSSWICSSLGSKAKQRSVKASGKALQVAGGGSRGLARWCWRARCSSVQQCSVEAPGKAVRGWVRAAGWERVTAQCWAPAAYTCHAPGAQHVPGHALFRPRAHLQRCSNWA